MQAEKTMIIKPESTYGIQTKYLGATTYRGERIKAFTVHNLQPDTVTLPYNYALSDCSISEKIAAHEPAMEKLHDEISHNPDIDRYQEKDCNHVAIASWTKGGYFFTFLDDNSTE